VCIKFSADLEKGATETLAMIRQTFNEEYMSCTWVFEWKRPNSPSLQKAKTGEEHAHCFV
jgi:hypothetical protein